MKRQRDRDGEIEKIRRQRDKEIQLQNAIERQRERDREIDRSINGQIERWMDGMGWTNTQIDQIDFGFWCYDSRTETPLVTTKLDCAATSSGSDKGARKNECSWRGSDCSWGSKRVPLLLIHSRDVCSHTEKEKITIRENFMLCSGVIIVIYLMNLTNY